MGRSRSLTYQQLWTTTPKRAAFCFCSIQQEDANQDWHHCSASHNALFKNRQKRWVVAVAIPAFKQPCKSILLIIEPLKLDARAETINHLWQLSFPGSAIFWCLGHLAADPLLCVSLNLAQPQNLLPFATVQKTLKQYKQWWVIASGKIASDYCEGDRTNAIRGIDCIKCYKERLQTAVLMLRPAPNWCTGKHSNNISK